MWYQAMNEVGNSGMIPANYVGKNGPTSDKKNGSHIGKPWYHGDIGREEAIRRLNDCEDGSFLLRDSTNYPGDFTLCLIYLNQVENYHVLRKGGKYTIDEEVFFDNLSELITYYGNDANGLVTELKIPCPLYDTNKWEINIDELEVGECIGKGEFGEVHCGIYKDQKVAIKSLHDKNKAGEFLKEARFMMTLKHKNLVKLVGIVNKEKTLIVSEFMEMGSLIDFLRSRGRTKIKKSQLLGFAKDTCEAMCYLEENSVVHRDLAARNVLLSEHNVAKVTDFGLARQAQAEVQGGKFPIKWTAPEALKSNKFTSHSDVWSYGIFLWELYSFGRVPYPRIHLTEVPEHVQKGYRMEPPEDCPTEMHNIMEKCWNLDASKRPTFKEIKGSLMTFS
ncbi:DgyrCDS847 [Dimorphilus gyrociliatus]|nr:DgyrCDS847 [Dimorphilus gyrociliatus]